MTTIAASPDRNATQISQETIISTSPGTGRRLGEVKTARPEDAPALIERARAAQKSWFAAGLRHRVEMMRRLKDAMHRNMDLFVNTLVAEQGKVAPEAISEFLAAIEMVAYYGRVAERALSTRRVFTTLLVPHHIHWVERHPYGVELVIAPWNFPLVLSIAPIVAALVSGNAVVFKPSEFATQSAEVLMKALTEAGFPHDVFIVAHGHGDLGAALVRAKPNHITFTGSVPTGRKVAAMAGELLIPVTLELGAKDAAVVLEDANLARTAVGVAWGALTTSGQACLSIERVYVQRSVAEPLIEKMKDVIEKYVKLGPSEAASTTMGAITTEVQARIVDEHVQEAVRNGAKVVTGGRRLPDGTGRYFVPTLLSDVKPDMRVLREETFGPVIVVVPFDTDEEAIKLVNEASYGLTASVWTRNRARGMAMLSRLDVGHASLNDHIVAHSIPQLPWGGVKDTGYGRSRGISGLYAVTWEKAISAERFAPLPRELFWYPYTGWKTNLLRRLVKALYAPTLADKIRTVFSRYA